MLCVYIHGELIAAACNFVLKTKGTMMNRMGIDTSAFRLVTGIAQLAVRLTFNQENYWFESNYRFLCICGGIGRHTGLKILRD